MKASEARETARAYYKVNRELNTLLRGIELIAQSGQYDYYINYISNKTIDEIRALGYYIDLKESGFLISWKDV